MTVEAVVEPTRAEIVRAATLLADGAGLDAVDAPVVRAVLRSTRRTDRQLRTLWAILQKYRVQLGLLGVRHEELVPPPAPPPGTDDRLAANVVRIAWVEGRQGRRIAVRFEKDVALIEAMKALRGVPNGPPWYDGASRAWILPDEAALMERTIKALEGRGAQVHVDRAILEANARAYEASRAESAEMDVPTKIPLYPFQKAGVRWIEDRGGRAMVADEPGLGKTATTLGFLARHPEALPALVVCPATLKANWYKEVRNFTDLRPMIISSKSSLKAFRDLGFAAALSPEPGHDVVVMNYDLFEAETPRDWVLALIEGDTTVVPYLVAAGKYALEPLKKAYEKCGDIQAKGRLLKAIGMIEAKDEKARGKKFVRAAVNGRPLREFMKAGFRTFVLDESHYCQDREAQRTKASQEISNAVRNVIALTGTPILNMPKNLWSQLHIVNRSVFPSFLEYGKLHCGGRVDLVQMRGAKRGEMREVWDFSGASNLEELDRTLRSKVMIRRLKAEVLKELPPKIRVTIPIVLERGLEGYRREARPILERLAKAKAERDRLRSRAAAMGEAQRAAFLASQAERTAKKKRLTDVAIEDIEALKQLAVNAKFNDCVRFVLEQPGKVVVFMSHHETIDRMAAALEKAGRRAAVIDGRVPGPSREPIKERFQSGDLDFLVCGIRAASEGLTLTASHTVVVCEFDWNPARHQQAEDRVHRIGQSVAPTIYYLVALGTIEEKIVAMIDNKFMVACSALGETDRILEEAWILDSVLDEIVA